MFILLPLGCFIILFEQFEGKAVQIEGIRCLVVDFLNKPFCYCRTLHSQRDYAFVAWRSGVGIFDTVQCMSWGVVEDQEKFVFSVYKDLDSFGNA